jgi:hypothetical protein
VSVAFCYYDKTKNDRTTQHIFLDVKRQLHASATKDSHNQDLHKRKQKYSIYNCSLWFEVLNFTVCAGSTNEI